MPAVPPYERDTSFTDFTIAFPDTPHRGQDLDQELDQISAALAAVIARQNLLQRDDDELANATVGRDQIKPDFIEELIAEIGSSGLTGPQGPAGPATPGPAGVPGPAGPPLPWIVGGGAPNAAIGTFGQLYLNAANGDVYQRGTSNWVIAANIRGPEGQGGGGGGGVTDHGALTGLTDPDHPISAISGLQDELVSLQLAIQTVGNSTLKVYSQNDPPTANLNAGDLWFDTNDNNRLYRWNGAVWVDVADARINQIAADAAAALQAAADAQATADGKVTTFYGPALPSNPALGDLWIRTDQGNRLHRWSGAQWVVIQDQGIADALAAAGTAQATADGKIESYFQPTAPVGASLGDLWFDTDDDNHQYRFNGASWVSVRDAAVAQAAADAAAALQAAADAQAVADGKIDVFYQAAAPNGDIGLGDLWIDTDDNQLYRWNGSQWQSLQDAGIQDALTAAALAQATADGKLRAFYQTSAPGSGSGRQTGDLWFDTDDHNKPYRFNGSTWVDISPLQDVDGGQVGSDGIKVGAITADKIDVTDLSAISANIGTCTAGLIRDAGNKTRFDVTNGRIIFDNGTHMKVQGAGFGSASQFLEWFGPSLANINQCTEANAITYLKTNGEAYFGGSLSAGTLFNSRTTSDLAADAEVTVGPFGTNGNPITVTLSYSMSGVQTNPTGNSAGQTFPISAQVRLYRSLNSGAESLVATLNVSGNCNHAVYEPELNRTICAQSQSGSLTYTDNTGGTATRTFRAEIVSRNTHHPPTTQRITITATED